MTDDDIKAPEIDVARQIDVVCRRFESAWQRAPRPRIEDYLAEIPDEGRSALRSELEALERELRALGDPPERLRSGPAAPSAPRTDLDPAAVADAPTIVPATAPVPARRSVHEDTTVAPRHDGTVDFEPACVPETSARAADLRPPEDSAPNPRVRYFGDYEIIRELARGGMGVVFQARQISLNRVVALKMILAGQLADDSEIRRFYTEAEAAANLDHAGIVPIHEVGQHEGQHYFSMGFVEGESLAQRLALGPLPVREAAALMVKVAEAIEFAHQRGVIHRDLKPANILIDPSGNPRVTDFGLARKLKGDSGLTGSGQIVGTPSYMPPEQAGGNRGDVGPAADVYALGATLYALLTVRPPFQAASAMDTVLMVVGDEPVPPRRLNASIPRDLDVICVKCLEKSPARRYASASALADDLGRWLRHEPILARRASSAERLVRWARRRPAVAALSFLIFAAIVASIGLVARDLRRNRDTIAAITKERNASRKSESEAISARNDARREATQNLRRLVRVSVDNGNRLVEDGNPLLALPWYAHALKNEPDGPLAERRQRIRLASVLGTAPRLTQLEVKVIDPNHAALANSSIRADPIQPPQGQVATRRIVSADGKLVLLTSAPKRDSPLAAADRRRGTATVWDAASGKPVFPTLTLPSRVVDGVFLDDGRRFVTVMETELRQTTPRQELIHCELGVWSGQNGKPVGEPVSIPLANVRVELNAVGDRLLIRGDHLPEGRGQRARACQVRDVENLNQIILPRGGEVWREARFSPDGRLVAAAAAVAQPSKTGPTSRSRRGTPPPGVELAPDGRLSSVAPGPLVRFHDTKSGDPLPAILNHEGLIDGVAFAPDGASLITSGGELVRLWNVPAGEPLTAALQGQSFIEFSFDGRLILLKSSLGAPQVWWRDPQQGRVVPASPPLPAAAWSPTIRPDRNLGLSPSSQIEAEFTKQGHDVVITSRNLLENLVETRRWAVRPPEVTNPVVFATDETNIVGLVTDDTTTAGPTIRPGVQRVVPSSARRSQLMLHSRAVLAPDGKTFLRYIHQRSLTAPTPGPNAKPRSLGRVADAAFELFSTDRGQPLGIPPLTSAQAVLVMYSEDSRRILLVSCQEPALLDGILHGSTYGVGPKIDVDLDFQILNVPSLKPAGPVIHVTRPVGSIALSPDGRRLAVTRVGTTMTLDLVETVLDQKSGKPISNPKTVQKPFSYLDALWVYNLQTGQAAPQTFRVTQPEQPVPAPVEELLFSPDGRFLLVRSARPLRYTLGKYELQPASLLDAESLEPTVAPLRIPRTSGVGPQNTQALDVLKSDECLAAFSPDARLVAFADGGNLAGVFETATGKALDAVPSHTGRVLWIRFSPDGQKLATTGSEGLARLWNSTTGAPAGPAMRHPGVTRVDFSPDQTYLLTSGGSGFIQVWDSENATPLIRGLNMRIGVQSLVFGPGALRIVFCLNDQAIPITWDLPVEERPVDEVEALSIALSGHEIDSGEGVSLATPERVEAARANLAARQPAYVAAPR
jgi:serine/threonine protein kinase/WD40 repeat protein